MIQVRRLSDQEERFLKGLVTSRQATQAAVLRARVILLSSQKWSVPKISQHLGIHHHSVRSRIRRFNSQGLDALHDMPRSGRPRIYGQEQRETVVQIARTDPAALGLPLHSWTLSALQHHLAQSGVAPAIGRETIRRILLADQGQSATMELGK